MEHQVQLVNKLLLIILISLVSCNYTDKKTDIPQQQLLNKAEQNFQYANGLLMINNAPYSGKLFTLYPDTKDTAEIAGYINGKEHGGWKKFYPDNKIKEIRYFDNGQKTGEYLAWWPNGTKELQYYFINDEYEGICREWNDAGMITKVLNYKKGHEEGQQQWWYENGKIKANYIIKDGRRFGLLGTKNCINVSDSIFNN